MPLKVAQEPELETVTEKLENAPLWTVKLLTTWMSRLIKFPFRQQCKTSWTLFYSLCPLWHIMFHSTWNKVFFPKPGTFLQTGNSLTNQPSRNKVKWWIKPAFLTVTFKFPLKTIEKIERGCWCDKGNANKVKSKPKLTNSKVNLSSHSALSYLCCAGLLQISPLFCILNLYWRQKELWPAKLNFIYELWSCSLKGISVSWMHFVCAKLKSR